MAAITISAQGVAKARNALLAADRRATVKSFATEARRAFLTANRAICPVDTGFLRDSFDPRIRQNTVSLHWGAEYASQAFAWPQHRNKDMRIARVGADLLQRRLAMRIKGKGVGPAPALYGFRRVGVRRVERQRPAGYGTGAIGQRRRGT